MGGKTFENTMRLSEPEYCRTKARILAALENFGIRAAIPPPLQGKTSHGDVDVIVATNNIRETTELIHETLEGEIIESKTVGKTGFLLTKDRFQVDLIPACGAAFDLVLATVSHGHFNHLLNMILKKQALALKKDGLAIETNSESSHIICTDLEQISSFFGFPTSVFDGKTRFTPTQIVDIILKFRFFDVRGFSSLEGRDDLLKHPIFATLLHRIKSLTGEEYKLLCRDVKGENKAGRVAANHFGFDFNKFKAMKSESVARKKLFKKIHGGFFVHLVPELRKKKEIIQRMPQLLLDSRDGDWTKLNEWFERTSEAEKKQAVESILAKEFGL